MYRVHVFRFRNGLRITLIKLYQQEMNTVIAVQMKHVIRGISIFFI